MKDPYKRRYFFLMVSIFGAISLSIVVFFALFRFQGIGDAIDTLGKILAPFIYGGVVAYLLRPMCNIYERALQEWLPGKMKKIANSVAVGLSLLTGILVVYTLIIMIAPQLYSSIRSLWNTLPDKVNRFLTWAKSTFGEDEELLHLFNTVYTSVYQDLNSWADNTLVPYISSVVSGVGSSVYKVLLFLYNLLIGLIVACYLLGSRKRFARQSVLIIRSLLKPRWADLFLNEVVFVDRMFGGFIDGKLLDSAIMGVLCYLGCLIFRFPNALLVSAIVGITNVIPFFGPFIGGIPSTLLIMIENPMKGLWFIVFILALQQLDGNIIGPKILGDRTGLSSFWVLFAIVLFGGLWGLVGMVICVPVFAVLYDTVKKLVRRGLTRKGQIELWEKYKADYPDEPRQQ
ncbi:AI-2E family transporter [bacterium]|nr:AI-2E family transporter [bacterium]MDY4581279.1 AI-2E family transporter [Candidatus Faecousia sp.]